MAVSFRVLSASARHDDQGQQEERRGDQGQEGERHDDRGQDARRGDQGQQEEARHVQGQGEERRGDRGQEGDRHDDQGQPDYPEEEEEAGGDDTPALSETDDEEEEDGAAGGEGHSVGLEAIKLIDNLHLGGYWPVGDQATRSRRPPPRLGVEEERGYWEDNLPRELSMGDQGSRQLTPHPSPPRPDTEQLGTLDDALTGPLAYALGGTLDDALTGPLAYALGDAPGNQPDASTPVPSTTPVPVPG